MKEQTRRRRRTIVWAMMRPLLMTVGYLLVYFTIPLNGPFTWVNMVELFGLIAAMGAILAWQTRTIIHSDHPRLRAAEALAASVPLFLLAFAAAYYEIDNSTSDSFSTAMTRIDSLYFTITVFATVGFGDIVARSQPARVLVMVQMLLDLVVVGLVVRILLDAVRRGLDRRDHEAEGQ